MKAHRFSLRLFLILMIISYCTANAGEIDPLEYQVYKEVIEQEYLSQSGYIDMLNKKGKQLLPKTIIIINQTIPGPTIQIMTKDQFLDKIEVDYPFFPVDALESWRIKNKDQYELNDDFKFTGKHFLISKKQLKLNFPPNKRWETFYNNYPNALGYFRLSRVGFDADKKAGIVYIENSQHGKWGSGYFWLLKKENGKWVCTGRLNAWVS